MRTTSSMRHMRPTLDDEKNVIARFKHNIESDVQITLQTQLINDTEHYFADIVMEHMEKGNHSNWIQTSPQNLQDMKKRLEQTDSEFSKKYPEFIPLTILKRTTFTSNGKHIMNDHFQTKKDQLWNEFISDSKKIDIIINQNKKICEAQSKTTLSTGIHHHYDSSICEKISKKITKMPKKLAELTYFPTDFGLGMD